MSVGSPFFPMRDMNTLVVHEGPPPIPVFKVGNLAKACDPTSRTRMVGDAPKSSWGEKSKVTK